MQIAGDEIRWFQPTVLSIWRPMLFQERDSVAYRLQTDLSCCSCPRHDSALGGCAMRRAQGAWQHQIGELTSLLRAATSNRAAPRLMDPSYPVACA